MRKVLSVLVCVFMICPASATGDATPTSKGYVDAQMATLQDNLPGAAANTVVTTTATAGETGTKAIYDASGNYAEQQNALVTAEDANTAIQMAIEGELVCREYDPTGQYCYVYDVRPATAKSASKNLFNLDTAKEIYRNVSEIQVTKTDTGYSLTNGNGFSFIILEFGDVADFIGKTLTLSMDASCTNGVNPSYLIGYCNNDCSSREGHIHQMTVENIEGKNKIAIWLYASSFDNSDRTVVCTYSNIQMEESSTATSYVPYQNLYMPSGN